MYDVDRPDEAAGDEHQLARPGASGERAVGSARAVADEVPAGTSGGDRGPFARPAGRVDETPRRRAEKGVQTLARSSAMRRVSKIAWGLARSRKASNGRWWRSSDLARAQRTVVLRRFSRRCIAVDLPLRELVTWSLVLVGLRPARPAATRQRVRRTEGDDDGLQAGERWGSVHSATRGTAAVTSERGAMTALRARVTACG